MKPAELIDYCLTFKGSYLDFPFGEQCACIRVGKTDNRKGRIFAQVFKLNETYMVTFQLRCYDWEFL